jgi:hypothetical protein
MGRYDIEDGLILREHVIQIGLASSGSLQSVAYFSKRTYKEY